MNDNDVNLSGLVTKLGLNRRQFLAATTGMAAAAAVTAPGALASPVGNANGILIPAPRRGIILYTVRDAVGRDPLTTDLASGFKEVLKELSTIGYRQIEFAGYRQHANAEGGADLNTVAGATLLRSWLDDNGLEAEGNHGSVPSTVTDATIAAFDAACEIANILGLGHIGTGSDPTGSVVRRRLGPRGRALELLRRAGRRATGSSSTPTTTTSPTASCSTAGRWTRSADPTRSSGIRRLEYFLANTDPKHVYLEMDIYWAHVAQYKHRTYTAPDGSSVQSIFDPAAVVAAQTIAVPAVPRQGRQEGHHPGQRLRHGAVRSGRHRLLDVPSPGRRQGLAQPDVGAGHRARRHRRTRAVAGVREDQLRRDGRAARLSTTLRTRPPSLTGALLVSARPRRWRRMPLQRPTPPSRTGSPDT